MKIRIVGRPCRQSAAAWLLAALLLAVVGCGDGRPQRVAISGKVLIDDQPLERGFIQVLPDGERAATGQIGAGGSFQLTTYEPNDGCVTGNHKVLVIANESQGPTAMKWFAPKKYASVATSGLTLEVSGPRDDVVIKLTWDGGQPFVEKFEDEGTQPDAK